MVLKKMERTRVVERYKLLVRPETATMEDAVAIVTGAKQIETPPG
jgi:hypothetical protein